MAVGESWNGFPSEVTATAMFAERWNGTKWTMQLPPNPPEARGHSGGLSGVWCRSSRSCIAVGAYLTQKNVSRTLAENWNG
jgi:hypothetical protein